MNSETKKIETPHDSHIAVLDGLRAMAICLVLTHHAMQKWWSPFVQVIPVGPVDLSAFLRNGWSGVDLFFVLSGFLITGQLLDSRLEIKETRAENIAYYFRRRFCRITPAYYVVLTFVTAAFIAMGDPQHPEHAAWLQSYLYHLAFLQDFVYADYWPIFWSLAVEAQFYLLAPLIIISLLRLREPNSRYATIFLSILFLASLRSAAAIAWHFPSGEAWFYKLRAPFPFSLDSILAGMLCGFLWRDEKVRVLLHRKKSANLLFGIGLILFLLSTGLRPPQQAGVNLYDKAFAPLCLAFAFSLMMMGLLAGGVGSRFFSTRPLRFVATVSYSMYLLHMCFVQYVFNYAAKAIPLAGFGGAFILGFCAFFLLTLFASTIMYELVEKPFIMWAKRAGRSAAR